MTAKSVLMRPQGLRPGARAPTSSTLATPLDDIDSNIDQFLE